LGALQIFHPKLPTRDGYSNITPEFIASLAFVGLIQERSRGNASPINFNGKLPDLLGIGKIVLGNKIFKTSNNQKAVIIAG
jgi:hypothetical protein